MGQEGLLLASSHSLLSFPHVTSVSRAPRVSRVRQGSQDPKACQESKETR